MEDRNRENEREGLGNVLSGGDRARKYTRAGIADTLGNMTASIAIGAPLDYVSGLHSAMGIVASRASATGLNAVTGGPYGWWREQVYRATGTRKESGWFRKGIADLIAFNTFQVPIYGAAVAVGSLCSEGRVDLDKVGMGMKNLAMMSPLVAPTMGLIMSGFRKMFGVKSVSEGAYRR